MTDILTNTGQKATINSARSAPPQGAAEPMTMSKANQDLDKITKQLGRRITRAQALLIQSAEAFKANNDAQFSKEVLDERLDSNLALLRPELVQRLGADYLMFICYLKNLATNIDQLTDFGCAPAVQRAQSLWQPVFGSARNLARLFEAPSYENALTSLVKAHGLTDPDNYVAIAQVYIDARRALALMPGAMQNATNRIQENAGLSPFYLSVDDINLRHDLGEILAAPSGLENYNDDRDKQQLWFVLCIRTMITALPNKSRREIDKALFGKIDYFSAWLETIETIDASIIESARAAGASDNVYTVTKPQIHAYETALATQLRPYNLRPYAPCKIGLEAVAIEQSQIGFDDTNSIH